MSTMDIETALRLQGEGQRGLDANTIGAAVSQALAIEVRRLRAENEALRKAAARTLAALQFYDPEDEDDAAEDELNTAAGELDALLTAGRKR